jgi:hypothetical protein
MPCKVVEELIYLAEFKCAPVQLGDSSSHVLEGTNKGQVDYLFQQLKICALIAAYFNPDKLKF